MYIVLNFYQMKFKYLNEFLSQKNVPENIIPISQIFFKYTVGQK